MQSGGIGLDLNNLTQWLDLLQPNQFSLFDRRFHNETELVIYEDSSSEADAQDYKFRHLVAPRHNSSIVIYKQIGGHLVRLSPLNSSDSIQFTSLIADSDETPNPGIVIQPHPIDERYNLEFPGINADLVALDNITLTDPISEEDIDYILNEHVQV